MTNTTKTLNELMQVDTSQMPAAEKQQHLDKIFDIRNKAAANDIQQLSSVTEALSKSSADVQGITEKLSSIAMNDDKYSQALSTVTNIVKIVENSIPLSF